MFKFKKSQSNKESTSLNWQPAATQALEQAMSQAPVPAMLKGKVKKELTKAAEQYAQQAGHTEVTPEDLMQGLLSKMPASTRSQVEQAMQQGPEGIKKLQDDLDNSKP